VDEAIFLQGRTMTGSPSFEDVSRDLARAFVQRGAKAGDLLGPNNLPGQVLLSNELTDFPRALAIAVRHGWFQKVVNDQYRLTKTGEIGGSRNPVPRRVADLLVTYRGTDFCDDCIADALWLPRRQQAQQATNPLGASTQFWRREDTCPRCHGYKNIIRAN
jgi:hypothetical protein